MQNVINEIMVVSWFTYLQESTGKTGCHSLEKIIFNGGKTFEVKDGATRRPRVLDKYKYGKHTPRIDRQDYINTIVKGSKQILEFELWKLLDSPDVDYVERVLQSKSKLLYSFYKERQCTGNLYIRALDALVQKNTIESLECVLCLVMLCRGNERDKRSLLIDCLYSAIVLLSSLPHRFTFMQPKIGDIRTLVMRRVFKDLDLPTYLFDINFNVLDHYHSKLIISSDTLYKLIGQKFKRDNYHYYFQIFAAVEFKSFYWFLGNTVEGTDLDKSFENIINLLRQNLPLIDKRKGTRVKPVFSYFNSRPFKDYYLDDFFGDDFLFNLESS